jgi:hypothetical protein
MREMAEALARARRRIVRTLSGERSMEMVARHTASERVIKGSLPPSRGLWLALAAGLALVGVGGGFMAARLSRSKEAAAPGGAILVVTRPAGATIEVDGKKFAEPTPTMVPNVAAGPHTVRLNKGNLGIIERQVALTAGEHAVVNVVLPPSSHRVEVRSVPEGATVYLDGRVAVGETPTAIEVTDDEFHELKVEKVGYETASRAITPDDHDPVLTLQLPPEKQPRGTLLVDANTAAEVWLDGVDTGYTTPTLGIHVPLGEHIVEVRDGAGHRAQTKALVQQGQTIRLLLSPGPGSK